MERSGPFNRAITAADQQAKEALKALDDGNDDAAVFFPAMLVDGVLASLKCSGHFVLPHSNENQEIPVADLLHEMAQLIYEVDGFSLAPLPDASGKLLQPSEGHCVALPGTDYKIKRAFHGPGTSLFSHPTDRAVDAFQRWVEFMEPVLMAGMAWFGGFRLDDTSFVTEATLVFKAAQEDLARCAAIKWEQVSYWTIDSSHPSGGYETSVGGTPCRSRSDA